MSLNLLGRLRSCITKLIAQIEKYRIFTLQNQFKRYRSNVIKLLLSPKIHSNGVKIEEPPENAPIQDTNSDQKGCQTEDQSTIKSDPDQKSSPTETKPSIKPESDQKEFQKETQSSVKASADAYNKMDQICLECRNRFPKRKNLYSHVTRQHNESRDFWMRLRCEDCKLTFHHGHLYQRHFITLHDTRTDEEVQASSAQKAVSPARPYKKSAPPIKGLPVVTVCEHCGKDCKQGYRLRIHMQSHELNIHSCNVCQSVLKNIHSAGYHFKRSHREEFDKHREDLTPLLTKIDPSTLGIDLEQATNFNKS